MLSASCRDPDELFHGTHAVLTQELKLAVVEPKDLQVVRLTCELISRRAAKLAGTG